MQKTAIVYDKWLSSLGGGEVVACNFARILADAGYKTTFVCGKFVDPQIIKNTLNIDLFDIKFVEIWNDEAELKKISKNADIFVNSSFIDYSYTLAKLNLFYVFFPTEADDNLKGKLITKFILPVSSHFIKPRETISVHKSVTKYALYYLNVGETYHLNFKAILKEFSKSNLESIDYSVQNAKIIDTSITVSHTQNTVYFDFKIIPTNATVLLKINNPIWQEIFISPPEILTLASNIPGVGFAQTKFNTKLRAGLYTNTKSRVGKYDKIFATSAYAQKWIKKYWGSESTVLYPPVPLMERNNKIIKKNQICSVGRFFTIGHGKKQDIMIKAFKKMCDKGLTGWELHLAGGLGSEPTSQQFADKLKQESTNYPIFFHFNKPRKFIENLYQESKVYWHAAGFGINSNRFPIKFEHFGITPIEAMSAGCIPVLFNGGGLSEVVTTIHLDPRLHLFNTIDQLATNTTNIINQKTTLPSDLASQLTKLFGFERFKQEFLKTISSA